MSSYESKTSEVEALRELIKDGRYERITHNQLARAIIEVADSLKWRERFVGGRTFGPDLWKREYECDWVPKAKDEEPKS